MIYLTQFNFPNLMNRIEFSFIQHYIIVASVITFINYSSHERKPVRDESVLYSLTVTKLVYVKSPQLLIL